MRILIIRNYPSYMAVKNNTYNIQEVGLAKALVRKGHVCDIVFWTDQKEETVTVPVGERGQVHVFYRRGKTMLKNTVYSGCRELFEQYDILQPCEYNQMQSWLLAKQYPEKTVIYHGPYDCPFNTRYNLMCKVFDAVFLRQYIRQGTRFLAKSGLAKDFLTAKGIRASDVRVVGVGMDAEMLCGGRSGCSDEIFLRMQENNEELKVLYVGRLEKRRNIPFLFEVFAELCKQCPNAVLYLIGTGDAAYVDAAFAHAQTLGIRDRIVWQERMEQKFLSGIYEMADFFLLPTEYEIFGMVLLEAMYYKTVVLTTENGGSSILIEDGKNGFVLKNRDPGEWACCMKKTYDNKAGMRAIGEAASERIEKQFTWDVVADGFVEQYRQMTERK